MKFSIVGPGYTPIPPVGWGAVESLIWKVPSVRVINPEHPHFFDLKDGVNNIKSWKELDDLINAKRKIIQDKKIHKKINNIFYKLDNRAHLRFWNFINDIYSVSMKTLIQLC